MEEVTHIWGSPSTDTHTHTPGKRTVASFSGNFVLKTSKYCKIFSGLYFIILFYSLNILNILVCAKCLFWAITEYNPNVI